jgi:CRISPR system Cascade subunit CasE
MPDALFLVSVPIRADQLAVVARRKHIPPRDLDEGYLSHCVMRELWQDRAPAPFVLRDRGRLLEAWGYSHAPAESLLESLRGQSDSWARAALGDPARIASRPVPQLRQGQRVGFLLRACPVVRLAGPVGGHRAGAEVDAFLARCFSVGPDTPVSREDVYREWASRRLSDEATLGIRLEDIRIAAVSRERLVRRTQGAERTAKRMERPDVRFEGTFVVSDPERFLGCLGRGVGRHRAFGFGAILLVPPGTSWSA